METAGKKFGDCFVRTFINPLDLKLIKLLKKQPLVGNGRLLIE
jgi:hypothetical protein